MQRPARRCGRLPLPRRRRAATDIPVILLGGILTAGSRRPKPALFAVAWIIIVVIPALNRRHFKNIPYDFCLAGLIFSLPLITIGAANAFGWIWLTCAARRS